MEAVNKVVDAGYKALWGEDTQHATATGSTDASNQSGFNYVVDAGKKALWGSTATGDASSEPHGEEPVSGERGSGTAMDPYDAGNREEEEAVANPIGSINSNSHVSTEQRNIETNQGTSSGTAAAVEPDMLKTTVTGLQRVTLEPSDNTTDSASRVIVDNGPGQSLKHTSEPFQKKSDKIVEDLQGKNTLPETTKAFETAPAVADSSSVPGPSTAAVLDEPVAKTSKEEDTSNENVSKSSFSGTSSDASGSDRQEERQRKKKTSKLQKVKNKLHIGSPKSK